MSIKNLIISSLIGGIVIAALANIPVINFINCLLCIGYWAGAILAVWLYKKLDGTLTVGQGVVVGAVSGIWSGLINFILGFIGAASVATILSFVDQFIPADTVDLQADFVGRLAILFNLVGVLLNIALGTLGGLIGGAIFQTKPESDLLVEVEPELPAPEGSAVEEFDAGAGGEPPADSG
ncbi:MAG: hypothetical protein JSV42_15595 [Chloroflexota bacterium]|nr:MAG: hypothetical protein JSV42_15595 [Chloroflexota bacterium]